MVMRRHVGEARVAYFASAEVVLDFERIRHRRPQNGVLRRGGLAIVR
jgi:hypothetical protein